MLCMQSGENSASPVAITVCVCFSNFLFTCQSYLCLFLIRINCFGLILWQDQAQVLHRDLNTTQECFPKYLSASHSFMISINL